MFEFTEIFFHFLSSNFGNSMKIYIYSNNNFVFLLRDKKNKKKF